MEKLACLTCEIFIGVNTFLISDLPVKDWFVITDSNVYLIYEELLRSWNLPVFVLSAGEEFKTRKSKGLIEDFLLENGCKKNSGLIAFGGGVICDIVGFVSSTYMRGIEFFLIPTSLLAMVDSSIGGKNAVDTKYGKNLIGTIYRPTAVYIDLCYLKTLPKAMWAAGMSEVIKIAAILDKDFFEILQSTDLKSLQNDQNFMLKIIKNSVELKRKIVELDENELKLRMILNFGHTVGHAIEAEIAELNHGLCVSIGMFCELQIAKYLGRTRIDLEAFKAVLISYDLPYKMLELDRTRILIRMKSDKKRRNEGIPIYVPDTIGHIDPIPILVPLLTLNLFLTQTVSVSNSLKTTEITVPGSKSLTNRYILLSALSPTPTLLKSVLHSEDTSLMISCLESLNLCQVDLKKKTDLLVSAKKWKKKPKNIYVGNAGTVARFLAMTCMLVPGETIMRGSPRMHLRPIRDLVDAINSIETRVFYLEKEGFLPLLIKGGGFQGGVININCSTSSQYISSILMAAPLASQKTELHLYGKSEPTSISYIDLTIHAMLKFGAQVQVISPLHYIVQNTGYKSPGHVTIEPDAGSASYFFAIAALHQTTVKVRNIGLKSAQGELEFVKVLEKMGCEVQMTENFTEVTGKKMNPVNVDMGRCTDCFITAAMVMSVCEGVSEIIGIGNQRVKECDRIAALVKELKKVGVLVEELLDGIRIFGGNILTGGYLLKTYEDHRLAMGFAVLGTVVEGIKIADKDVVCKTFPGFWKSLNDAGVEVKAAGREKEWDAHNSIVLIGMRGVGKSMFGLAVAEELHWELIDIDNEIAIKFKTPLADWILANGISAFRLEEFQMLAKCISRKKCVIVTGGGIIEHPGSCCLLKSHYPVVWISTSLENIKENLLASSSHRLPIDIPQTYKSRKGFYRLVHDYRFFYESREFEKVTENFRKFIYRTIGEKSPLPNDFSFFGCVTEKTDLNQVKKNQELTALEIRADQFSSVKKSLKRMSTVGEIIKGAQSIFTYRSENIENYWKILSKSLKFNPDFVDVQFTRTNNFQVNFAKFKAKCKSAHVILSYHSENSKDAEVIYERMHSLSPDILKFICPYKPDFSLTPLISFQMGEENTISRLENTFFSPVKIDSSLAPGQLTYYELIYYQHQLHIKPERLYFYLAGNNISKSPGPGLYNSLFSEYGLPFEYKLLETNDISEVIRVLHQKDCLGMSVTIPFKELIIKELDQISPAAKQIGSVNTITKYKGSLIGNNTDWQGLYFPILHQKKNTEKACVLGAGGTGKAAVFALQSLGIKNITVWNRSNQRLLSFSDICNTTTDINSLTGSELILNTLPGDVEVPLLFINSKTILFESAYFPEVTPIGLQATKAGATLLTGKQMYLHMARYQFMLFTGKNISEIQVINHLHF